MSLVSGRLSLKDLWHFKEERNISKLRGEVIAHVVECMLRIHRVLGSIPRTPSKNK